MSHGTGKIHFSGDLPADFYTKLTAEYRVTLWRHGHRVNRWEKKQADRNEALDMMVYNVAASQYLGLHKLSDAHWDKLAGALSPDQISLFATDEKPPQPQAKTDPSPREISTDSYQPDSTPPPIKTQPAPAVQTSAQPRPAMARPIHRPQPQKRIW